jgi:hypothetical protein
MTQEFPAVLDICAQYNAWEILFSEYFFEYNQNMDVKKGVLSLVDFFVTNNQIDYCHRLVGLYFAKRY